MVTDLVIGRRLLSGCASLAPFIGECPLGTTAAVLIIVISQHEYDIIVITESEAKPRMSVNNNDIIRVNVIKLDIT